MNDDLLTADELKATLDYDPATGVFAWKISPVSFIRAGQVAGYIRADGYVLIARKRKPYFAHRLAWLYMTGEWPKHNIDHINGNQSDNRFENLRDVTQSMNIQNQRKARGESGFLGVSRYAGLLENWVANISVNGKNVPLGVFDSPEKAHQEYLKAKRLHHPGCTI